MSKSLPKNLPAIPGVTAPSTGKENKPFVNSNAGANAHPVVTKSSDIFTNMPAPTGESLKQKKNDTLTCRQHTLFLSRNDTFIFFLSCESFW